MTINDSIEPTPYPDVNAILSEVYTGAREILGDLFVGMYLYGSLATATFDPDSSDIDFLVATTEEIRGEKLDALIAMHARIAQSDSKWAIQLEGSYIPRDVLLRYDPTRTLHPHIDRGDGILAVQQHDTDWVIQRYVLREYGITIVGPPMRDLIDPITPDDLRHALRLMLAVWWEPMLSNPVPLQQAGYRSYAIMTMCRVLYTYETGGIVPKGVATTWAQEQLGETWAGLIELANQSRNGTPLVTVEATLDFIHYTVERVKTYTTT
jgi:hypothetical protein